MNRLDWLMLAPSVLIAGYLAAEIGPFVVEILEMFWG